MKKLLIILFLLASTTLLAQTTTRWAYVVVPYGTRIPMFGAQYVVADTNMYMYTLNGTQYIGMAISANINMAGYTISNAVTLNCSTVAANVVSMPDGLSTNAYRPVYFCAYRTGQISGIPYNAWFNYTNNLVTNDSHNAYSTATGKYTIPRNGFYCFSYSISFSGGTNTSIRGDLSINNSLAQWIIIGYHNIAVQGSTLVYKSPILYLTNGTTIIPTFTEIDAPIMYVGSGAWKDFFSDYSV